MLHLQPLHNDLYQRIIDCLRLAMCEKIPAFLDLGQMRPNLTMSHRFKIALVRGIKRNAIEGERQATDPRTKDGELGALC